MNHDVELAVKQAEDTVRDTLIKRAKDTVIKAGYSKGNNEEYWFIDIERMSVIKGGSLEECMETLRTHCKK